MPRAIIPILLSRLPFLPARLARLRPRSVLPLPRAPWPRDAILVACTRVPLHGPVFSSPSPSLPFFRLSFSLLRAFSTEPALSVRRGVAGVTWIRGYRPTSSAPNIPSRHRRTPSRRCTARGFPAILLRPPPPLPE